MDATRNLMVRQTIVGEPERRDDERSKAARSGGSPTIVRETSSAAPDPEVTARHVRRRFTTQYKLDFIATLKVGDEIQFDLIGKNDPYIGDFFWDQLDILVEPSDCFRAENIYFHLVEVTVVKRPSSGDQRTLPAAN